MWRQYSGAAHANHSDADAAARGPGGSVLAALHRLRLRTPLSSCTLSAVLNLIRIWKRICATRCVMFPQCLHRFTAALGLVARLGRR